MVWIFSYNLQVTDEFFTMEILLDKAPEWFKGYVFFANLITEMILTLVLSDCADESLPPSLPPV